jgi:hypothetical protein
MRVFRLMTAGCVLALAAHAPAIRAQDDAVACGRKAVEEGVGSSQVDDYVKRCVADMKAARGDESGTAKEKDKDKSKDKDKDKAKGKDKSKDTGKSKEKSKDKGKKQ